MNTTLNIVKWLLEEAKALASEERPTVGIERVLVVEDDDAFRRILSERLASSGAKVDTARSVEEAVSSVKAAIPYSHVYLDLNLQNESGIAALRRMRRLVPNLKVTVVSGYVDDRFDSVLQELGCRMFRKGVDDLAALLPA